MYYLLLKLSFWFFKLTWMLWIAVFFVQVVQNLLIEPRYWGKEWIESITHATCMMIIGVLVIFINEILNNLSN